MRNELRRVLIVGPVASGKTTLSVRMARTLDLPVFHTDAITFGPGFVDRGADEVATEMRQILRLGNWIIDGYCPMEIETQLADADAIVLLDPPRLIRLWRLLQRAIKNWAHEFPEMTGTGCVYDARALWLDLYWGILRYPTSYWIRLLRSLEAYCKVGKVHRLVTTGEVRAYLNRITA